MRVAAIAQHRTDDYFPPSEQERTERTITSLHENFKCELPVQSALTTSTLARRKRAPDPSPEASTHLPGAGADVLSGKSMACLNDSHSPSSDDEEGAVGKDSDEVIHA